MATPLFSQEATDKVRAELMSDHDISVMLEIEVDTLCGRIGEMERERELLMKQRGALDWEAAQLRVALLFVWSKMRLSADGGTATFTHDELRRIGPSKISDEADALVSA